MKQRSTGTAPVPCTVWAEKLAAAHPNDLSIAERTALNAHVAACPACAAVRNEYREMDARILGLPPVAPLAEIPAKLQQVLGEQDKNEQQRNPAGAGSGALSTSPAPRVLPIKSNTRKQRLARQASAIAAVLVVGAILGGFLLLFNGHHTSIGGPAPTSAGAVVFALSDDSGNDGTVYAVRPGDGTLIWQSSLGHKLTGALAVSKDTLFTGSFDGTIYALRKSNGSLLWQKSIRGAVLPSMLTDGTTVYFGAANNIYALRASDGTQLWRHPTPICDNCAADAVVAVADGTLYAFANGLYALRASDGNVLWHNPSYRYNGKFAAAGGKVYVAAENEGRVYVLRASDGSRLHTFTVQKAEPIEMVAEDDRLYLDSAGHDLYAVRTSDYTILWHKQFNDLVMGLSGVGDGNLYFAQTVSASVGISVQGQTPTVSTTSSSTDVYALRTSDGSQLWHWHPPAAIGVTLRVFDGQVYLATTDGLYALRAGDGTQLWHVLQGKALTSPLAG